MAISNDPLESLLGSIEIGHRAIEKAKTRIGTRNHGGQWLSDLVSNRGRYGISGHESRLSLATLGEDGAEQLLIERLNLVQQDDQDESAGYETDDPDGIPAEAKADRSRVVA